VTSPLMPTYPSPPLSFVRGEGSYLFDSDGRRYLDCLSGLAVTSLGHAHPAVAEALHDQASTLLHVSNLFGTEPGPEVARTLDLLVGDGEPAGGQVFFCNSGAEANECALKLARRFGRGRAKAGPGPSGRGSGRHTPKPQRHGAEGAKSVEHVRGRHVVVSAYGSFHGRTLATLHATGQPAKHEPFQPLPEGFRHVAWDDLDALAAALDPSVAGVLLEPVQGEGGVVPASADYFQGVRRLCDERGVLLIVDEVQTGLGRTGRWFGFQHFGVQPDVVTMAKALGNGVPIGACWARAGVASAFEPGDHAPTFGGQPLATAAARAVLDVMQAEDVPGRAARAGARFRERLDALPAVAGVRGLGLLLGVELSGRDAGDVNGALLGAGLVANAVTPTALRLAPSLLISDDEIDEATDIIEKVLQ
jgi:acetylornithine/N-succinyldiaminopimelate aminotransferase